MRMFFRDSLGIFTATIACGIFAFTLVCAVRGGVAFFTPTPREPAPVWQKQMLADNLRLSGEVNEWKANCAELARENARLRAQEDAMRRGDRPGQPLVAGAEVPAGDLIPATNLPVNP